MKTIKQQINELDNAIYLCGRKVENNSASNKSMQELQQEAQDLRNALIASIDKIEYRAANK